MKLRLMNVSDAATADKTATDGSATAEIKSSSPTSQLVPSRAEVGLFHKLPCCRLLSFKRLN